MTNNELVIHGTFLNIFGVGTLLTGEPGIGKSELALALITKRHKLIADDAPLFYMKKGKVYGRNLLDKALLSVRGIGLIDIKALFGPMCFQKNHPLNFIIHLKLNEQTHALSHLIGEQQTKDVLGSLIPCVTIPIITPRNLEILVETIVKIYLLNINRESYSAMNFNELLDQKMESNH